MDQATVKQVGEYLAELRAQAPQIETINHAHGSPCRICDDRREIIERAMLGTDPECHKCGVLHPHAPSCPVCGANHYATREDDYWLCCYCNTVFRGSADEWSNETNTERRRDFTERRRLFLALYDERYNAAAVEREGVPW